jgi:hypothetical protein
MVRQRHALASNCVPELRADVADRLVRFEDLPPGGALALTRDDADEREEAAVCSAADAASNTSEPIKADREVEPTFRRCQALACTVPPVREGRRTPIVTALAMLALACGATPQQSDSARSHAPTPSQTASPAADQPATAPPLLSAPAATLTETSGPPRAPVAPNSGGRFTFTVELLSRGRGVPAPATAALKKLREYVEADVRNGVPALVTSERIGIEGETRTCFEYASSAAGARAYGQAEELLGGLDLVNLKLGSCPGETKE